MGEPVNIYLDSLSDEQYNQIEVDKVIEIWCNFKINQISNRPFITCNYKYIDGYVTPEYFTAEFGNFDLLNQYLVKIIGVTPLTYEDIQMVLLYGGVYSEEPFKRIIRLTY